jgi:hypothetical protein
MSEVTLKDLEKVKEPCKSCRLTANGRGKIKRSIAIGGILGQN